MKEFFFLFCLSVRSNTIVLLFLKIPSKVESPIGLQVILGRKFCRSKTNGDFPWELLIFLKDTGINC